MASWHTMKTPVFKPTHMFTQTILCLVIKLFLISLQGQLSNCCYCYVANHCRWDADPKEISSFYNSKKSCGPDYGNNTTIPSSQGADVCGLWAGIGPRAIAARYPQVPLKACLYKCQVCVHICTHRSMLKPGLNTL